MVIGASVCLIALPPATSYSSLALEQKLVQEKRSELVTHGAPPRALDILELFT